MTIDAVLRRDLQAQLAHWTAAIERLGALDDIASPEGWADLERRTGVLLTAAMTKVVRELSRNATAIGEALPVERAETLQRRIHALRRDYLRTETTLDFFADAINSRAAPRLARLLRALDFVAGESMRRLLTPLGHGVPGVLVYIDKGLGASILKAGLRLWDQRSINPVAAIKVVRHNLLRPTALLHEAGHQCAHLLGWNDELAAAFREDLPGDVGEAWGSWASEVAADAFSFAHAGYASVAALRNVVDGGRRLVFRYLPGDPHPIAALRVQLGLEMCAMEFGPGPWDEMGMLWRRSYPPSDAPAELRGLLEQSSRLMRRIAELTLRRSYDAFEGRSLAQRIDPAAVSPRALSRFAGEVGPRLFTSPYVARRDSIRLLALSGYWFATDPRRGRRVLEQQVESMTALGQSLAA